MVGFSVEQLRHPTSEKQSGYIIVTIIFPSNLIITVLSKQAQAKKKSNETYQGST